MSSIHIIGGGLAGCEAAWQAAALGVPVTIHEMRPARPTAVHKTDGLAELVCSNSFRGDKLDNAVGLLKEEMRRLGSLIMRAADMARVPAGAALAVDRVRFSEAVTREISSHPLITLVREEIPRIPDDLPGPLIVATGPLTSDSLSEDIAALVGGDHLYFYDAISPIVLAETIDMGVVFRASRWGRSLRSAVDGSSSGAGAAPAAACGVDDGEGDYLNCPMDQAQYAAFHEAVMAAEKSPLHEFDDARFFEGCLPIEVMAARGIETLRFGPMKPVGLPDPRTGREPVRGRAVAAGRPRRRSLQPRRLPDADEVGRTGARPADDSRAGAGGVRPLRHDPSQHLHQRADRAARDLADPHARRPVLRRADLRRRGIRRVGRVRADGRTQCRARASSAGR